MESQDNIKITVTKNEKVISDTLYNSKTIFELDTNANYLFTPAKYKAASSSFYAHAQRSPVYPDANPLAPCDIPIIFGDVQARLVSSKIKMVRHPNEAASS